MINIKRNSTINVCGILSLFACLISQPSEANSSKEQKGSRVEMKCYVELVGGVDTIYRAVLSKNKLLGLEKYLVGNKISIAGEKKKQIIYSVIECRRYKENFTSASARLAEENTAG
jgi:hypothetical protein